MGSKCSTIQLDESDIEEIQKETGCKYLNELFK